MSDYSRNKCVRYKLTDANIKDFGIKDEDDFYNIEKSFPGRQNKVGYFDIGYGYDYENETANYYIDYVIIKTYAEETYEFGKIRLLTENELNKYKQIFSQVIKNSPIEDDNFRLVDYCYYNCSDPPDYFDLFTDPFYDEV